MANKAGHRSFGMLRKLPSKRWQASYTGPDGARHTAPATFVAKMDAEAWLAAERRRTEADDWAAPKERQAAARAATAAEQAAQVPLSRYADSWLADRDLKPRTRALYRTLLDRQILPTLGDLPVAELTPALVRDWHAHLDPTKARLRAHGYALLKAICATAVVDELLPASPCRIRGAGQAPKRLTRTEPATAEELAVIAEHMPKRLRLLVLLAAWCALRYGEVSALRRSDIDTRNGVVKIRQAVAWIGGTPIVGAPKSDAGSRDVAIPPHLFPAIREHLRNLPVTGRDALLFPAATDPTKYQPAARVFPAFARARAAAGRPDLRFHDLRHTGATFATQAGGSLAEIMQRLGHSTPRAALGYQHAARGRDAEIAAALSAMAGQ